jgi:hypothetical protein
MAAATHLATVPGIQLLYAVCAVRFFDDKSGSRTRAARVLGLGGVSYGRHVERTPAAETLKHDRDHMCKDTLPTRTSVDRMGMTMRTLHRLVLRDGVR